MRCLLRELRRGSTRLAPVATSHARGEEVFQQGPLDATREEPAPSLYRTLLSLGRSSHSCKELEHAGVAQSTTIQVAHVGPSRAASSEGRDDRAKVFSIFEEHTRWVSKGKAGCAVELGVPVMSVYQFILHHKILWEGSDEIAVSIINETRHCIATYGAASTVPQPRQPGATRRHARPQCAAAQGSQWPSASRASASICRGKAPAPGGRG